MQTLTISPETQITQPTQDSKSFWKRQFQEKTTKPQREFDWIFGVVLPVLCFTFDPIVFKSFALLGQIKPFAYILSYVSIMTMTAFLLWGKKLQGLNAFLAGVFIVGSVISLIIGVILFPLSLIGLTAFIGVLGFTPLFSAIVFLRNGVRAYKYAKYFLDKQVLLRTSILTALLSFSAPFVINSEIEHLKNQMIEGDIQTIKKNTQILKYVTPITSFESLRWCDYECSGTLSAAERKQLDYLLEAYKLLSGKE